MTQKVALIVLLGILALTASFTLRQNLQTDRKSEPYLVSPSANPTPSPSSFLIPNHLPNQSPSPVLPLSTQTPSVKVSSDNSGQTTVEISDQTLNDQVKPSLVGQSLGSTPLGETIITSATLSINNGYIGISGTAKNGPVELPFQTKANLDLVNSQPKLSLSNLTLNNILLPQFIANQLANSLQSKVDGLISSYHFQLTSISLQPGKIILSSQK